MRKEIQQMLDLGVTLIPVRHRSKKPLIRDWQNRVANDNNPTEFEGSENVGMVLGKASSNIIDIDLDDPMARALAPHFLPETGLIFGRAGSPRSHYLYKIRGETGGTRKLGSSVTSRPILEYRSDGSQTVVPPSIHKSGEPIEWVSFGMPGIVSHDSLWDRLCWLATAVVLAYKFEKGKRQDIALAFSGAMLVSGKSVEDVTKAVGAVCEVVGDEEKAQRLDAVNRTAERHTAGEAITQWSKLIELIGSGAATDITKFLKVSNSGVCGAAPSSPPHGGASDLTDAGVGAMFAAECSDKIMWIEEEACLYAYEDGLWHRDEKMVVSASVFNEFVMSKQAAAVANPNPAESQAQVKGWTKYRGHNSAMHAIAQSRSGIRKSNRLLDADDSLFGCRNGVIDLRTGEFHEHSPTHYITVRSEVAYEPEADCPLFKKFLLQTFGGNQELVSYIQGMMGYWLTGRTDRQELYVFHGEGSNGKSTLISTVSHVIGPFAMSMMSDTLFEQQYKAAAMADIATLRGRRLAVAQEAESDVRINSSLVKNITGGDAVKSKALYSNPTESRPGYKVVLVANVKPTINVHDKALTRRIKLIPFDNIVSKADRDLGLPDKLKAESSGILNFMLEGARKYYSGDIVEPDIVKKATEDYFSDSDTVTGFLNEMTVADSKGKVDFSEMCEAYSSYCADNAILALEKKEFNRILRQRGFNDGRSGKSRYWRGVRLTDGEVRDHRLMDAIRDISNIRD